MKKIYSFLLALIFVNAVNAQCPTFSISAPSGNVVGCNPITVPLNAVNTSTLAGVTYTWIGSVSGTTTGVSINATAPNTYSVYASAPSNTCIVMQLITIFQSTLTPNMMVNPISRTLTCNGGCASFTATSLSGTTNIVGNWYAPGGNPISGPSSSPIILCANSPGTYSAQFCSAISGCCTSQTVAVVGNTIIPSVQICPINSTINCASGCVPMICCLTGGTLAPTTYTWTNLTTSVSSYPISGSYTACVPGQYEVGFMDGNFCKVSQTITIAIDTLRPSPLSSTSLPSNSYTLTCFNPSLVATALTNPMYPASNYSWTQPPSLVIPSNTISIGMVNITSSLVPTVYTVSAMGANGCIGKQKVNFYKDIYVPLYGIAFTPSAITCANPCVAMTPTTAPTTTTAINFTFTSPPPTTTATTAGALFCIPGTYTMTYMNIMNGCVGSAFTSVPVNSPCGVNEINVEGNISIAPNPNNGKFNVEINTTIENAEIKIVNAIGQEVYRQNIKQGKTEINVGVLAKGIYHYSILQNKQPVNRGKILIE